MWLGFDPVALVQRGVAALFGVDVLMYFTVALAYTWLDLLSPSFGAEAGCTVAAVAWWAGPAARRRWVFAWLIVGLAYWQARFGLDMLLRGSTIGPMMRQVDSYVIAVIASGLLFGISRCWWLTVAVGVYLVWGGDLVFRLVGGLLPSNAVLWLNPPFFCALALWQLILVAIVLGWARQARGRFRIPAAAQNRDATSQPESPGIDRALFAKPVTFGAP